MMERYESCGDGKSARELLEIAGRSCILCEKDAEEKILSGTDSGHDHIAIVIGGDRSFWVEIGKNALEKRRSDSGINMWERLGILQR